MTQTSRPESTRNLPNGDLQTSDEDLVVEPLLYLGRIGTLEEQLQRLGQVALGILDGIALAGDVQFGAEGNIAVSLALDNGSQLMGALHTISSVLFTEIGRASCRERV